MDYGLSTLGSRLRGYPHVLTLSAYSTAAAFSLSMFVYGATMAYLQPQIWRNSIIRVMVAAQLFNCMFFTFRIFLIDVEQTSDAACRVITFATNAMSLMPVNLCVYCAVYLQLVVIHKLSPELRWPRVVMLTTAATTSLLPPSVIFYIPPRLLGRSSVCDYRWIPSHREYVFYMYTYATWAYVSGVVGFASILTIAVHLFRTRRATRRALRASAELYGPSRSLLHLGRINILHKTLFNIAWLPLTPIVSLWFNAALVSIAYYRQDTSIPANFISFVLLCLQSLLLGLPLLINPAMRAALAKQLRERRQARQAARTTPHLPLPPLRLPLPLHNAQLDP